TGTGLFDVYQDDAATNNDFPGRVVIRNKPGDDTAAVSSDLLNFRSPLNKLLAGFTASGAYRLFKTANDLQPALRLTTGVNGGEIDFGPGGSTVTDIILARAAANLLGLTGNMAISAGLRIGSTVAPVA